MDNDSKNTESGFFTMKGYAGHKAGLTASMEDYLEMIFRLSRNGGVVRISELAACLHVRPPSASKMSVSLKDMGFVSFQKYGYLSLTDKGKRPENTFYTGMIQSINFSACSTAASRSSSRRKSLSTILMSERWKI